MRHLLLLTFLAGGLCFGYVPVARAQLGLLGDTFTFSANNFPDNLGITIDPETQQSTDHGTPPVPLTFDGVAEPAGGMLVKERITVWPGRPGGIPAVQAAGIDGLTDWDLVDWENPGEIVEFSFQTRNGRYIASDEAGQSGYTIRGLDWFNAEPNSQPEFFETGWFFYYSRDGVPASGYETMLPEIGLLVGAHPFDQSIPEVVYIAYSRGQVNDITEPYAGGMDLIGGTSQLDENNGSWDLLGFVMGLDDLAAVNGQPANGFHIGFLVTPPEGSFPRVALRAGDADQDLDFDQLDLIRVQQSAKYLTGRSATWGEGDWNAAPGGSPGNPPPGDGVFNQLDIIKALAAGVYLTGPYSAVRPQGQRNDAQVSVVYDARTGELAVDPPSGVQLTSVNIDSAAGIFTGQPAQNLGGSFDNDADGNIFKATFGSSFGAISFGNVAQAGLAEQFVLGDLTVVGSLAGGGGLGAVDLIYVPEPSSLLLLCLALAIAAMWTRRSRYSLC
jgi:hypothetical protein